MGYARVGLEAVLSENRTTGTIGASRVPDDLLGPLVDYYRPRRVILFGSHARGEAGADSDFDLFVVVDDDTPPERLSWRGKYEARKNWHRAVDIVTCRASVFDRKRGLPGTISHTVDREGVVVYERG